jgi:peptide chain release factor subunit 1
VLEPPSPVQAMIYRCSSSFVTEPLQDMIESKESYGYILVDRHDATIVRVKGSQVDILYERDSRIHRKHRQGGQSSVRFARLIDEEETKFFRKVAKAADELLETCLGIFVAGPGMSKERFLKQGQIPVRTRDRILDVLDISDASRDGVAEAIERSQDKLAETEFQRERAAVKSFLAVLGKNGPATYGNDEVVNALQRRQVSTLLVAADESMPKIEIDDSVAIVRVSSGYPEGNMFCTAFRIGAVLRWKN